MFVNTMDGASALFFCSTGGRLCSSMYVCLHVLKKFLLALTRIWGVDVSTSEKRRVLLSSVLAKIAVPIASRIHLMKQHAVAPCVRLL